MMTLTREQILEKIKEVVAMVVGEDNPAIENCTESATLTEDVGLDSVGVLYVVVGIEENFSIRFNDVGFDDFRTVGDVVDYIQAKLAQ